MSLNDHKQNLPDRLLITAQSTREDVSNYEAFDGVWLMFLKVDSARRVVKRIKLEVNQWKSTLTSDNDTQDSEGEFPTVRTNIVPRSPHTRQMSPVSHSTVPLPIPSLIALSSLVTGQN
jgi:hypothetical protein